MLPPSANLHGHTLAKIDVFDNMILVAGLTGETSNHLIEALEDWARHLAQLDLDGRRCEDDESDE